MEARRHIEEAIHVPRHGYGELSIRNDRRYEDTAYDSPVAATISLEH
jgi:hypothetical protein